MTQTLIVRHIENLGNYGEYPALQNVVTGRKYVDITLGIERFLKCGEDGLNVHGQYVGFNLKGAWHSFEQEPECTLKSEITFQLQN